MPFFYYWRVADPRFPREITNQGGKWANLLFPAATKLWPRLCFYSCLWFCPRGGSASVHAGILPSPRRSPPKKESPPCQGDPLSPPRRRPPGKETPQEGGTPLPRRPPAKEIPHPQKTDPPAKETPTKETPSRPTSKGEIEGDQVQAHTQGEN